LIRFATWNIWNTQGEIRRWRDLIPDVLLQQAPDIVVIQEVSLDGDGLPQSFRLAQSLGLPFERYFFSGDWRGREEGLAILSRYPMKRHVRALLSPGSDMMGRSVCGATLDTPDGWLDVYTTHYAHALNDQAGRVKQAEETAEFVIRMAGIASSPAMVLAGDLNDIPNSPPLTLLRRRLGLIDALDGLSSNDRITFSAANPNVDPRLGADRCLDYVLHSERCVAREHRLFGVTRSGEFASDHFGVLVSLELSA